MWKILLLVFSVLLLVCSLSYSEEVCFTPEEFAELEKIWTELEKLSKEQSQELAFQEIQLNTLELEIKKSEACLSEVELSLIESEREHRRKTVVWAMGSFLAGSIFGLVAGVTINR